MSAACYKESISIQNDDEKRGFPPLKMGLEQELYISSMYELPKIYGDIW